MKRLFQWVAVCALLLQLVGCGGATGSLSGKVTLDGQPVTTGSVIFTNGNSAQNQLASIQSDGSYKADGVPVGDVKVAVSVPPSGGSMPADAAKSAKLPPGIPADHPAAKAYAASSGGANVPKEYTDPTTSNLTVKVAGGSQTYDIPLKSTK